ncbi:MAG: response regulator transcription factor [Elusimicrobiota bacterium]
MSRILIIEDDADLVQMMSHVLYQANYEVHYAFNGKEGYDKILSVHPDLILLDLKMPKMSGTEVLKLMAENTTLRDIPVIVMTAHAGADNLLEGAVIAQGAREFVKKPFELKELLLKIRIILRQSPKEQHKQTDHIAKGVVRFDPHLRTVWINDKRVATLAPKRAKILQLLLQAKGIVSREKLMTGVWDEKDKENLLEKTIQRLREDLGPEQSARLVTHPGGYEIVG